MPLTHKDWKDVAERVRDLWGSSGKWRNPNASFRFVQGLELAEIEAAVDWFFLDGSKFAPGPPEIIGKAHEYRRTRRVVTLECQHRAWAIIGDDLRPGGFHLRHVMCVTCRKETWMRPNKVMTVSERIEGEPIIRPEYPERKPAQPRNPGRGDRFTPGGFEPLGDLIAEGSGVPGAGDLSGGGIPEGSDRPDGDDDHADPTAGAEEGTGRASDLPDPF